MVKLQSESVMAARVSTEEVLDLVTVDNDFRVSGSESSEEEGEGMYAYRGERSFSSMDVKIFQEVACLSVSLCVNLIYFLPNILHL